MSPAAHRLGVLAASCAAFLAAGCSASFWDRSACGAPPTACAPCAPAAPAPGPRYAGVSAPTPRETPGAPLALAPEPLPAEAPPPAAPTDDAPLSILPAEIEMLARVNRVREVHDLRPLAPDARLFRAAKDHSWEQARHGFMGHGSPDPERRTLTQRVRLAGFDGSAFGEVVAWGYPSLGAVVEGWMNSPDHRRILLDPELTVAGFGQVGEYWTGNLGAPRRSLPLAEAPNYARGGRTLDPAAGPAAARALPAPYQAAARPAPAAPAPAPRAVPPAAVPAPSVRAPAAAVPPAPRAAPLAPAPAPRGPILPG